MPRLKKRIPHHKKKIGMYVLDIKLFILILIILVTIFNRNKVHSSSSKKKYGVHATIN